MNIHVTLPPFLEERQCSTRSSRGGNCDLTCPRHKLRSTRPTTEPGCGRLPSCDTSGRSCPELPPLPAHQMIIWWRKPDQNFILRIPNNLSSIKRAWTSIPRMTSFGKRNISCPLTSYIGHLSHLLAPLRSLAELTRQEVLELLEFWLISTFCSTSNISRPQIRVQCLVTVEEEETRGYFCTLCELLDDRLGGKKTVTCMASSPLSSSPTKNVPSLERPSFAVRSSQLE
jgi:hypothetical protein